MKKPSIIVLSLDKDTSFRWMSDGWYMVDQHKDPEAKKLFRKAQKCVDDGKDVKDVIEKLKKAGFSITRNN